jgi:hypothetical protein
MRASKQTAANVMAANIVKANTLTSIFQPQTEPMRARDYLGATVLVICAAVAAWFWMAGTP